MAWKDIFEHVSEDAKEHLPLESVFSKESRLLNRKLGVSKMNYFKNK